MLLEIVTHSWHFSQLLTYHLSSVVLSPPKRHHVRVTVCYCQEDTGTHDVFRFFRNQQMVDRVEWHGLAMSKEDVCNRAIGRNFAALRSRADWLWFADADYCVLDGFFDKICDKLAGEHGNLIFPREVSACPHEVGARLVAEAAGCVAVIPFPVGEGRPHFFARAIGGVQFARGSVCREKGYCNDQLRTLQPSTTGWVREISDSRFRRSLGTNGKGIDCPGLYRIRHANDVFRQRQERRSRRGAK